MHVPAEGARMHVCCCTFAGVEVHVEALGQLMHLLFKLGIHLLCLKPLACLLCTQNMHSTCQPQLHSSANKPSAVPSRLHMVVNPGCRAYNNRQTMIQNCMHTLIRRAAAPM